MIQEKDFLYRVPVKTAPITTPGGQIRNPEILVDLEGGEFMHGNILDANSTNKLINQSVKDAVDDKFIESGYVTKDLLDAETTRATEQENSLKTLIGAETSARTKGDEDLGAKIQTEQTRAQGKEKEISDKLAIVDGDSNTEGSFRKAIADAVAAAPEDLDTLKEIADKLAGNDDLYTALNQAITEKADASALLNEVTRATGVESGLQAAIATKADATALSNYVLTTALNKQVDTLNTAISAKQDAGNYIPYKETFESNTYILPYNYNIGCRKDTENGNYDSVIITPQSLQVNKDMIGYECTGVTITYNNLLIKGGSTQQSHRKFLSLDSEGILLYDNFGNDDIFRLNQSGLKLVSGDDNSVKYGLRGIDDSMHQNCLATSDATFKPISDFVLKTELPTVPTKTSQLTNDSNFIAANHISDSYLGFEKDLKIYREDTGNITTISHTGINFKTDINDVAINEGGFFVSRDSDDAQLCSFTPSGIKFANKTNKDIPTANGDFVNISDFATQDDVSSLRAGLSRKQDKITVNEVDITDIETADITKLRTIVTNLISALSASDLIRETLTIE